jgi:hypothetical protein
VAEPHVTRALATLADVPVPPDVAARIGAALADQPPLDPGTAKVVDISSRRRRWVRLGAGTTAAAATVAAIFAGVIALSNSNGANNSAGTASRPEFAAPGAPGGENQALSGGAPLVLHSGTDYTPATLPDAAGGRAGAGGGPAAPSPRVGAGAKDSPQTPPMPDAAGAGSGLARLGDPAALRACLDAIVKVHGGTPSVVDYARYQGRPALIVVLAGTPQQVVVAGPDCGLTGPAEIYHTTR